MKRKGDLTILYAATFDVIILPYLLYNGIRNFVVVK
jgi:hypothetical protein